VPRTTVNIRAAFPKNVPTNQNVIGREVMLIPISCFKQVNEFTSDQHPWFQRARRARPGSSSRNFYVWSDTDQKYVGTRIILVDTERSNWTWDEGAGLLLASLLLAPTRFEFR
jgi:hypothetical protein